MFGIFSSQKQRQKAWQKKTIAYAKAVNTYVQTGLTKGWENAGQKPKDNGREKLVPNLLNAIRCANETKEFTKLRLEWPLAYTPLVESLEERGQIIPKLTVLQDGSIIARIGAHYEKGYVVKIQDNSVSKLDDIDFFGVCPNNIFFAYPEKEGVKITQGWQGTLTAFCPYPHGNEGTPSKYDAEPFCTDAQPTQIIPFPDGQRMLFICREGIVVLTPDHAIRLLPTQSSLVESFEYLLAENPELPLKPDLSMEHGNISPDGKFISVGYQYGSHLVYNDEYKLVADIGPHSEYPHFSLFSRDGKTLLLNSCHFYNGVTLGINTDELTGIKTEPYNEDSRIRTLETGSRVYAAVHTENEFIIGNAFGHIKAFDHNGKATWQHFLGSNICDLVISKDEKTLVCSTCAGFISIIKLGEPKADYEIGTGNSTEVRRWLFWKGEEKPLIW
ncbi:hypothetical protein [Pseudoalteromonas luteoviolacea]|uniref:SMP-30/Gluconolactonase/LRE-like region domain-containing protein n=1 Tax=Pseudoalteromonas luteoviolacea DSM 6061 TaxID=1365250 RepID=A0A161XXC7_9GAMM|nr:hypothetical protein [Pseudoalteromonas luteoviolacea]KZN38168.1 hypothetical protein N475_16185 [Pseudoalteromonas luteoviolacea DSM 6061]MBE0388802.1 hypothetical protein [Pseudoalteromonas luteoviolacea DSM 6061]